MSTETKPRLLEVGDVLYVEGNGGEIFRHEIRRVTPTQAMGAHTKFSRQLEHSGNARIIGPSQWGPYHGHPETIEWKRKWINYTARGMLLRSSRHRKGIESLTNDDMATLFTILKKIEDGQS